MSNNEVKFKSLILSAFGNDDFTRKQAKKVCLDAGYSQTEWRRAGVTKPPSPP